MKRFLAIAVLIAVTVFLTACGYKIESGIVVDKKYIPTRTYMTSMLIGKVIVPQTIIQPAQYKICVQSADEEGAIITEWWSIDSAEYSKIQIGMEVGARVLYTNR